MASVGLAVGLVGALLCILAKRAGSPKVKYFDLILLEIFNATAL